MTGRLEQRSWETPEGDKRSKVEVVADEIGPSIRGPPPRSPRTSGAAPPTAAAAPVAAAAGAAAGARRGGRRRPAGYGYSEEPF